MKQSSPNNTSSNSNNNGLKSFDWRFLTKATNFSAAKVSAFKHAPMSEYWDHLITPGIKVEVINADVDTKKLPTIITTIGTRPTPTNNSTTSTTDNNNKANTNNTDSTSTTNTNISTTKTISTPLSAPTTTANTPIQKLDSETSNSPQLPNGTNSNNSNNIKPASGPTNVYWIASVMKVYGYMALLRYEGYEDDSSHDFWIYLFNENIHGVGWCAWQGKALVPPKTIESKVPDWTMYLIRRLTGSRTLPENFCSLVTDSLVPRFRNGLKLEVVDKNRISSVRVATVERSVGGRLLVSYDGADAYDRGFWCHERSPLVHPIGWAQFVGHELVATFEYAAKSIEKVVSRSFEPDDATWDMFEIPYPDSPAVGFEFREGMKLEAIDPLNLSSICVASVIKVLRANYLMIGIDGIMCPTGSDWFCYHASSPYIFPAGFCKRNSLQLTPPQTHQTNFDWDEYLKETKSIAAPEALFRRKVSNHGFEEGMHLEAVDLMQSRLVCVATVIKVVDRLLRIHFNGWDESFDQWCDCESPDLFPIGWCKLVGYHLESPKQDDSPQGQNTSGDANNRRRRSTQRGRTKKRKASRTSSSRFT